MMSPRTVIDAFLPSAGKVALEQVYDTANAAGVADQPLRLALRRLVASGEVVQTGRGRAGAASLTDTGRLRLEQDRMAVRLALAQDQGLAGWDGRWQLLAVSAPESDRAVRDTLRRTLTEAGAAPVSTSLYVTPHDLSALIDDDRHLVHAVATHLDVRGTTDPQAIAELLWPQEPLLKGYAKLQQVIDEVDTTDADSALVQQLRLADALEDALRPDPLIPPE
ncbi:PaaX family transcriptional regulator, partial [Kribbella antibiotica]